MNNNFLFKLKMTTILKVVLCSLFVFFLSCAKFEEENKQTQVVPNINEAQAKIGKEENVFEKHVNIEDFKNSIMTDFETYEKDLKSKKLLLSYNSFPKIKTEEEMFRESRDLASHYYYDLLANRSYFNSGRCKLSELWGQKTEPFVECFIKKTYNKELEIFQYRLLLPKEVYELSHEERKSIIEQRSYKYIRKEITLHDYCYLTGISKNIFKDLRVVTRQEGDYSYWYYQMPYKDNYLDYQNDTQEVENIDELKKFIKKGSLIFVFNKDLKELEKEAYGNWGHMLIVGDRYISDMQYNEYQPLNEYGEFKKDDDIIQTPYFTIRAFNKKISFFDYLKHFVFIEAQNGAELYPNNNKKPGFTIDKFTVRTSGNDKSFQMKLRKYTCVAVVNVNDGLSYSQPDLINTMIKNANRQVEKKKKYNLKPTGLDNDTIEHYCSGLAYYSLLNGRKTPSLRLLKQEHLSTYYYLGIGGEWFMPRTVCNSPYVYTRVWKKEKE